MIKCLERDFGWIWPYADATEKGGIEGTGLWAWPPGVWPTDGD